MTGANCMAANVWICLYLVCGGPISLDLGVALKSKILIEHLVRLGVVIVAPIIPADTCFSNQLRVIAMCDSRHMPNRSKIEWLFAYYK